MSVASWSPPGALLPPGCAPLRRGLSEEEEQLPALLHPAGSIIADRCRRHAAGAGREGGVRASYSRIDQPAHCTSRLIARKAGVLG